MTAQATPLANDLPAQQGEPVDESDVAGLVLAARRTAWN